MERDLYTLMHPKSVAIIGASTKPGSVGNELILRATEAKFTGRLFAVNPKNTEIEGVPCYPNITDIPEKVDVAIIAVPAVAVLNVLKECNSVGTKHAVIISSGFKEVGGEGAEMEQNIRTFAEQNDMVVIGPNCLGIFNTDEKFNLNVCFAPLQPVKGTVGFATQSGGMASGIVNILPKLKIGIAQMVSLGNQCQINCIDILKMWENDDHVKQILLYLEAIPDETEFRAVATRISQKKPILVIKSGRSARGAKASASHTGSLAGDDTTATGLFASCGVIRELYLRDLFNTAQVFSKCVLPKGENLAILTNAGGPGILATDTASDYSIPLADLTEETKQKLRAVLPSQANINNPVDIIASATAEQYRQSAEILLNAKEVDMLFVIYLYITQRNDLAIMQNLQELKKKYPNKPIVVVLLTTPDFEVELPTLLPNCDIPTFDYIVDAIHGLSRLVERKHYLESANNKVSKFNIDKTNVANIIQEARKYGINQLTTLQSLQIFKEYGLPLPRFGNAQSLKDAKEIATNIGYPVVLKISSRTVTHKSDIGGVITNIKTEDELEFWWNRLLERLNKANLTDSLDGIIVMQQISGSNRELVAGVVKKGSTHQMMFGLGGIFVEALHEVTFRPCPLTNYDAESLINGTKAKNILGAIRGNQATDLKVLKETLMRLSQLVTDFPEILEIDANPLMLDEKGKLYVVDARIII